MDGEEPQDVVETLCRRSAELLASLPGPVRRLSLQSGETRLELEWPEPAAAPAAAAAAPAAGAGGPAVVPAAEPAAEPEDGREYLRAPMVGTFYRAPAPGADSFVAEGDVVAAGSQIAIIEAMKLLSPVNADRPGRILEVLVEDGSPVEYDQPLFAIAAEPDEAGRAA
ncbi:acetyl-CoA carboxylase biotin carboxyl carrier protein [Spirillospora sp. NPDC052242]